MDKTWNGTNCFVSRLNTTTSYQEQSSWHLCPCMTVERTRAPLETSPTYWAMNMIIPSTGVMWTWALSAPSNLYSHVKREASTSWAPPTHSWQANNPQRHDPYLLWSTQLQICSIAHTNRTQLSLHPYAPPRHHHHWLCPRITLDLIEKIHDFHHFIYICCSKFYHRWTSRE